MILYIFPIAGLYMHKIDFSFHAKMRMVQRGINQETIKEILTKPAYLLDSFENRKIAVKSIGNKVWYVVFTKEENHIKVVTVYYECYEA